MTISLCASLSASSHAVFVIRDSSCTSDVTTKPSSELPLLARSLSRVSHVDLELAAEARVVGEELGERGGGEELRVRARRAVQYGLMGSDEGVSVRGWFGRDYFCSSGFAG